MVKKKILVVDDERNVCEFLEEFLEFKEFETFSALSGVEALRLIREHRFDLVLLDIIMPGMNGMEVLEKIKLVQPDIPIIVVSGVRDRKMADNVLRMGAADYIPKPIDLERLEQMIMLNVQKV